MDLVTNTLILNASVDLTLSSKRFDGPLLWDYYVRCKQWPYKFIAKTFFTYFS